MGVEMTEGDADGVAEKWMGMSDAWWHVGR
jgi:hypothetical protein